LTLTWNGKQFDWLNVGYFAAIHAGALLAPFTFSWSALGVFFFLYWLSASVGICLTYHRLLTHRGFRVPKPLEYFFTVCGNLASEGGAISWVGMHRMHHTLSDRPGKDLHTPKDGFWWSHLGWIICKFEFDRREMEARYAPELVADPVHRVLNVWGVFLRLVVVLHGTWFVNSAAHTFGYRTYDTPEGSTNCWWVGLVAWGEGWHNNHHAFQRSARHGHEWWEVDATWAVIRGLRAMGLARDVQLLPRGAERFRIDRAAEGGAALAAADLDTATAEPAA
jgi:stearoyl-CoA desaturase (delta-9 desaturase)